MAQPAFGPVDHPAPADFVAAQRFLSSPSLRILISWACLLFFGFGMLAVQPRRCCWARGRRSGGERDISDDKVNDPYAGLYNFTQDGPLTIEAVKVPIIFEAPHECSS